MSLYVRLSLSCGGAPTHLPTVYRAATASRRCAHTGHDTIDVGYGCCALYATAIYRGSLYFAMTRCGPMPPDASERKYGPDYVEPYRLQSYGGTDYGASSACSYCSTLYRRTVQGPGTHASSQFGRGSGIFESARAEYIFTV